MTPEVRAKTNNTAEVAKLAIAKLVPPPPVALREIDLRGNTVNEAIPIVENFLRECYQDNVCRVRIIHGKGIGVLRKSIRENLEKHKFVKSIVAVDKDHGGDGATEAMLEYFSVNKLN
ncbi:Smr/MutS family protein [Chloroflexota bacterium]